MIDSSRDQGDAHKELANAGNVSVPDFVRRLAMCQLRKSGNSYTALPRLHRKAFSILLGFQEAADEEV